ncbi:MAG TPA: hypothetical protein VHU40_03790 [Polyangia bacterium]|jgi:hypothetical protein|nr:hypothetical protein [Polyangia bacterium]
MLPGGRPVVLVAVAWLAAGACDGTLAPIVVGAGCPDRPLRGPEATEGREPETVIDDFESGDLFLPKVGGRNGAWIFGSDGSNEPTAEASSRCVARGRLSGHFAGAGFTDWGANWTAVLKNNNGGNAVPFDAHAFHAISFWAAVGGGAEPPFTIPMGVTTTDVAWNGGLCTTCMDYYATTVTLTPAWQRIVLPFDILVQGGWGVPQVPMRREQLVGFIMWPNHQFDIWIDDLRFEP